MREALARRDHRRSDGGCRRGLGTGLGVGPEVSEAKVEDKLPEATRPPRSCLQGRARCGAVRRVHDTIEVPRKQHASAGGARREGRPERPGPREEVSLLGVGVGRVRSHDGPGLARRRIAPADAGGCM